MHREDRTPTNSRGRSPSRAAPRSSGLADSRRPRSKPRLKIRAGTSDGAVAVVKRATGKPPRLKVKEKRVRAARAAGGESIRLAAGTEQGAVKVRASASGRTAGGKPSPVAVAKPQRGIDPAETVHTVDIRPSGTVVSRRPLAKRPAILHLPHQPAVSLAPPAWMLEACHVAPARAGDQSEILQLLSGLPAAPTRAEFHAAVDHPEHDSANRLVARLAGRIVGHVEVVPRDLLIGQASVRGAVIDRVAVLPECRGAGHGQRLVQAAEERMRQSGAVVAFSRTRIAPSFHELGWSVLGRDSATPGRPTDILARLLEGPQRAGEAVTMRQWRHVELPAILRIYKQNASRYIGPLDRNEAYSRWLVSRAAFDSIIVALTGQDRYELHESSARIVGYAIQAGNRVLEIMADPEFPGLEREILARVCAEAIENDRQEIVYEASASDPLHEAVAGGASLVQGGDRMIVAKVFRPLELLTSLAPGVAERVRADGVRETVELGLDAPGFRGSIIVADGQATVHAGRVGRSYLRLSDAELARLLLGQSDPAEAVAAGRMETSTQVAQKLAAQLFPRTPLWCPMWDDLPA